MAMQIQDVRGRWLVPVTVLATVALLLFWGFYLVDRFVAVSPADPDLGLFERYFSFDPVSITDAVSSLAGMLAAVLGIVITIVSIIVQLSAARYAGVAGMFFRDRVNVGILGYYVIACVCGIWLSMAVHHDYVPRVTVLAMLIGTSIGLVLMAPYFSYVFWFFEPMNIINRIQTRGIERAAHGASSGDEDTIARGQADALVAMEELSDITSNSISGKDRIIASGSVDALREFVLDYLKVKPSAATGWFSLRQSVRMNPDFVAMDPESLVDLEQRRTWVEWKIMRQYLRIFNEALTAMRDICYVVAIDTRYVGEAAARAEDDELVLLVLRFTNSYLRSSLNARDVRTAYNVLNQYRALLESLIRQKKGGHALEGIRNMSYYGHLGFDLDQRFVTETVAYDLSTLCQLAHDENSPIEDAALEQLLELDRPGGDTAQRLVLLGVRKAQVKLAAYYLLRGKEEKARKICRDMEQEPRERLASMRSSLEAVTSKDFWEIIDRGRNFEFMPPEQRAKLPEFFSWLGI